MCRMRHVSVQTRVVHQPGIIPGTVHLIPDQHVMMIPVIHIIVVPVAAAGIH